MRGIREVNNARTSASLKVATISMIHKSSLLAVSVIMLTLAACGGSEEAQVSLDDYITTVCGETVSEAGAWEESESLRELSEGLGFISEQMSALEPPAEVAEWHHAQIVFAGNFKETIDDFLADPGNRTEDEFLLSMFFTLAPLFEPVEQAVAGMNPDVRARMIEAGCIDEETAGVTPTEDSGPAPSESEEIRVGSSVSGSLDEPEDTDRFHFQAEAGEYYLIAVNWKAIPRLRLHLFQAPGYNWTFNSQISPIFQRWTPDVSGTINISVSAWDATGDYVLSVSLDASPETPSNVQAAWDGSDVRVRWDPVEGADYYIVYHEDFFKTGCSADINGNPSWCEQLATNVTGTSYTHTVPDVDENFYFVAACNSGGCSQVDTENPAVLTADQPGGPRSGGPCQLGIDLEPGDTCAVYASGGQADAVIFEVRIGEACYGDICGMESISREEFLAYGNSDGSWFINRLPEGHEGEAVPTASSPTGSSDARSEFEDSTPPGYTGVVLAVSGRVWGIPSQFTTDSHPGAVAYMLLGSLKGCDFADEEAHRRSRVYVKTQQLGYLNEFEAGQACRMTSSQWTTGWDGLRVTHLRFFDESASASTQEYVYDPTTGRYAAEP